MAGPNLQDAAGTGWQNAPTTKTTEARAVATVTAKYGPKIGLQFKKWYDAALVQDPNLTPSQAVDAFITAQAIGGGAAAAGGLLGQVPGAVAKGAENLSPGGSSPACALHVPGFLVFPGWCVISKTALRALVGGTVGLAAGVVGLVGIVVLASHGLNNTQAGTALSKSSGAVKAAATFVK